LFQYGNIKFRTIFPLPGERSPPSPDVKNKKYNIVAFATNSPNFVLMYRTVHTRQLMALLLIAVMLLVHVAKALHTHPFYNTESQETAFKAGSHAHESCSICEYHFTKDATHTNKPVLVIAPVYTGLTYTRLITTINSDHLFILESRGPPRA
jgi:hypothetical protein